MERPHVERQEGAGSSRTAGLLRAYHRSGDTAARERLVEVYLPLVQSFARRYSRGSDDYDDLYQVGCIGLIKAIDRFQPDRGDEFAAFAVPNIAGEIRRYLRDRSTSVRLPRRVLELRSAAARAQGELTAKLGRTPTTAEIARELSADEQDVAVALDAARLSQAYELGAASAGEVEPIDAADDRMFLSEAFRGLDEGDRRILYLRYVRDLEPADIARELGISPRQLSRRTSTALGKLRLELERSGQKIGDNSDTDLSRPPYRPKIGSMASTEAAETRYLQQPYHLELVRETGAGGGWSARVEELPDCVAHGPSPEEALDRLDEAMRQWIADALAHGREVPKPRSPVSHSGRLLVRMPQSMHAALAEAAEREETSLNQFINGALASAIGWRRQQGDRDEPRGGGGDEIRRRALMANLVVLTLVGLVAVVLLAIVLAEKL